MRRASLAVLVALAVVLAAGEGRAWAEDEPSERIAGPEADFRRFKDWAWFALGAASGFVAHEVGHIATDFATGHTPSFHAVKFGPIPFFAIQPCCGTLSRAEQYAIASAGFVVGDVSSELILHLVPNIRTRHAAFLKGVLIFDIALHLGYSVSGFLEARWPDLGPHQSDINSMARALGVQPWQVGLYLMAPAIVDIYRYLVPKSRFAPWVSLQGKALLVGLTLPLLGD